VGVVPTNVTSRHVYVVMTTWGWSPHVDDHPQMGFFVKKSSKNPKNGVFGVFRVFMGPTRGFVGNPPGGQKTRFLTVFDPPGDPPPPPGGVPPPPYQRLIKIQKLGRTLVALGTSPLKLRPEMTKSHFSTPPTPPGGVPPPPPPGGGPPTPPGGGTPPKNPVFGGF
jgi:hypothetical protein